MRALSTTKRVILLVLLAGGIPPAAAEQASLRPAQFLREAFGADIPKASVLWITPDIAAALKRITGHPPALLRQRYWSDGKKSAWILNEIGKEQPITAGFVVGPDGRILMSRVLIYRESRGMEVRYPAFLRQFTGIGLKPDARLSRDIDGISGATLSVRAMKKMAREALYLAQQARSP